MLVTATAADRQTVIGVQNSHLWQRNGNMFAVIFQTMYCIVESLVFSPTKCHLFFFFFQEA